MPDRPVSRKKFQAAILFLSHWLRSQAGKAKRAAVFIETLNGAAPTSNLGGMSLSRTVLIACQEGSMLLFLVLPGKRLLRTLEQIL